MTHTQSFLIVLGSLLFTFGLEDVAARQDSASSISATSNASSSNAALLNNEKLSALLPRWRQAMETFKVPGVAVAVVVDDETILLETLGTRDIRTGKPVTPDTPFYLASCTKGFTATAIMQLVEWKQVDLDAPVQTYLPRFELADSDASRTITVRDLLCHGQGLGGGYLSWLEAYTGEITEDRFYHFLKQVRPEGRFRYSNLNYTLAGRIIEAVTGKTWKTILTERIFKPLGMTSTTCYADELYARDDVAMPTEFLDGRITVTATRKTDRTMHAAGGNAASIHDIVKWMRFQLGTSSHDEVLTRESVHLMHRLHAKQQRELSVPGQVRTGYGFGWNLGTYKGMSLLEHGGGFAGTSVAVTLVPDRKTGIAVLCNAGAPIPPYFTADVLDLMVGETPGDALQKRRERFARWSAEQDRRRKEARAVKDEAIQSRAALMKYRGRYEHEHWGSVRLSAVGDGLSCFMGVLPLTPQVFKDHRFYATTDTGTEFFGRFELDDNGRPAALLLGIVSDDEFERFERVSAGTE